MVNHKVKYNFYDNESPSQVLTPLKRHLSEKVNKNDCDYFYVGQTDHPEKRLEQHQKKMASQGYTLWDSMYVVYGHKSLGFVTDVENGLIKHFENHSKYKDSSWNTCGPRYEGNQTYYVYVLIDNNTNTYKNTEADLHFCYEETTRRTVKSNMERIIKEKFRLSIKDEATSKTVDWIYVGFTNNPNRRFREHQLEMVKKYNGNIWDQMLVLYKTPSLDNAILSESILIQYAKTYYKNKCLNSADGRVKQGEPTYYYVYFLEEKSHDT